MKKALIVDDETSIGRAYQRVLVSNQIVTTTATRAKEALKLLEADPEIVVVLSDTLMPGMNGDVFHGEIVKRFPTRKIVFIAMTGDCSAEIKAYYRHHGITLLDKPIDFPVLLEIIQRGLAS